jgi:hypothetical protein
MCQLQDLQVAEIWSLSVRLVSRRKPRLRADGMGFMTADGCISRVGLLCLDNWCELPKIRNSVLVGLSDRRLADIQMETWEIDNCRSWMDERKERKPISILRWTNRGEKLDMRWMKISGHLMSLRLGMFHSALPTKKSFFEARAFSERGLG